METLTTFVVCRADVVKANPLNTYLSTASSITSPGPLAANSPLTIPVQITLSQFKLSGFVILVFSKAKGITLVFRNDPLESLKVSSTFDSIPFIADYLQKEIERQVRRLFQEDLPVAVHRLSLRLWNPEYAASLGDEATAPAKPLQTGESEKEDADEDAENDDQYFNPLLSASEREESSSQFSQKNLLKLSSLMDAQNTLSLDTPKIADVVFRAWASGVAHNATMWDKPGALDAPLAGESRSYAFSENGDAIETQSIASSRPSLSTTPSRCNIPTTPSRRKKKHRVVDLRKRRTEPTKTPLSSEPSSSESTPLASAASSECAVEEGYCERPPAPIRRVREDSIDYDPTEIRPSLRPTVPITLIRPSSPTDSTATEDITYPPRGPPTTASKPIPADKEKAHLRQQESWRESPKIRMPPGAPGGILEQAILSKIMAEIQRTLEEERIKRGSVDGKWGVERELENLCGQEELPAYRAI